MKLEVLVRAALDEDVGSGDITTELTIDPDKRGTAVVVPRASGVLSGTKPFNEVFRQLDAFLKINWIYRDADDFKENDSICQLEGSLKALLTGERTALNFLGRLSGIASLTRQFVDRVAGTNAVILDTRKTTPLLRDLEKEAVRHGGGSNHRQGLYDMVLIKDNHETAAGGITHALERIQNKLAPDIQIEVEIDRLDQINEVLSYNVDRILLDNFSPEMMAAAVKKVAGRIPLEASGGITLENVRYFAETGVDYISAGALTHSVPCFDFSLQIEP
jgi:nicotinate-nucleotide pyrophosphorylase (carboxylating)